MLVTGLILLKGHNLWAKDILLGGCEEKYCFYINGCYDLELVT